MGENKKRKGTITEEDVSLILHKYSAATILALLQEINQFASSKINWDSLVKMTSTGISCPREYQILWRHIAYQHPLADNIEDDSKPLDDDSDLEFELEPFPAVSSEASSEAAACVKVLMSSCLPKDSGTANRPTVEAPLTINIPNVQTSDKQQASSSTRSLHITIPVSVQKQPLPSITPAEGLDGNGSTSLKQPAKKKRKLWTKEEDMELIEAVQKCGEGNWQNILKEEFKHDRTASQLSQRWSILRKNYGKSNVGSSGNSNHSTLTDSLLGARQALSLALNMPTIGSLSAIRSGTVQSNTSVSSGPQPSSSEASPALPQKAPSPSQPSQVTSQRAMLTPNKLSTIPAKPRCLVKPSTGLNSLIQKAAFAAGGRIANPSTAASLFKAAQSKNAVRIRPRGAPPISQVSVTKPSSSATILVSHSNATQNCLVTPTILPSPGIGSQQSSCNSSKLTGQIAPKTVQLSRPLPPLLGELRSTTPVNDTALNTDANTSRIVPSSDVSSALPKEEIQVSEKQKIDSASDQGQVIPVETTYVDRFVGGDQNTMINLDVEDHKISVVYNVTDQDHATSPENMDIDDDQISVVNLDAEDGRIIVVDSVTGPSGEVDVERGIMVNLVDVGMTSKSAPLVVTNNNINQLKSDGPIEKVVKVVHNSGATNNKNSTTVQNVDKESLVGVNEAAIVDGNLSITTPVETTYVDHFVGGDQSTMVNLDVEDRKISVVDSVTDQDHVTSPENMDIDDDQIAVVINLDAEDGRIIVVDSVTGPSGEVDVERGIMVNLVDVGMTSKSTPLDVTNNNINQLKSDGPIEKDVRVVHNSGATNNKNSTTVQNVDKESLVGVNEAAIVDGNLSITTPVETTYVDHFVGGDQSTMVNLDVEDRKISVVDSVTDQDHATSPENMDIDDDQIAVVINLDADDGRVTVVDSVTGPSGEVDVEQGMMVNLVDVGMTSKSTPLVVTNNNINQLKSDGPIEKDVKVVHNSGATNNKNSTTVQNVDKESLVGVNEDVIADGNLSITNDQDTEKMINEKQTEHPQRMNLPVPDQA